MDFRFAKDRYDYELRRKEQLTAALTLPVGVLSILAGGIAVMARSFSYRDPLLTELFGSLLGADLITIALCLLYLARAYRRQYYVYLPLLRDLLDWEREYAHFARSFQEDAARAEDALLERIIEAADRNTANNDRRSALLYRSRIALFAVLCLSGAAAIPYVADQVRENAQTANTSAEPADSSGHPTGTSACTSESGDSRG